MSLPGPANIPQSGHNGLAIAGDGQQHSAALLRSSRSCSEFDSASSKERQSSSGSSKKVPIAMLHKAPSPGSDSSASSFDCAACEKRFTRSGDRERHEREIHHTIPQFYRCDVCGWDDIRLDKVQEHCRERHGQQRRFERYQLLHGTPDRVKRPRGPNKNPPKTKARR